MMPIGIKIVREKTFCTNPSTQNVILLSGPKCFAKKLDLAQCC